MRMTRPFILSALSAAVLSVPFLALAQQAPIDMNTTRAPIKGGGVVALDLPDSSAQAVTLDILKGRFDEYSVGRIKLTGEGVDFRNGTLQGLRAEVVDGDFENLMVDKMSLNTPGFAFDTMQLINNRAFILSQPVTARVNLTLSEAGLNRFIANPKTLEKIEKAIQKKTGGLKLLTFSNPSLALLSGNKIRLNVTSLLAQNVAVPMEMNGKLTVQNGQVKMTGLSVSSGGNDVPLPVDVADVFEDKLNEIIDLKRLGKKSFVITAESLKLNGKHLQIEGSATLTKLQFGA